MKNTFGYVRQASSDGNARPQPIARPGPYNPPLSRSVSKTFASDNIGTASFIYMFVELIAVALISAQSVDNWWLGQV